MEASFGKNITNVHNMKEDQEPATSLALVHITLHNFLSLNRAKYLPCPVLCGNFTSFHMWKTYGIGTFFEKSSFHIWNRNVCTYEVPDSHLKCTYSEFYMWNLSVGIMYFTYKMEVLHMKINFT